MKAIWNGKTVAEASNDDLIKIEGNWYFPPESINREFFKTSYHHTTCFWKGQADYYDVVVDGNKSENGAWFYAEPMDGSIERVGKDFANYVAFWNGVEVVA